MTLHLRGRARCFRALGAGDLGTRSEGCHCRAGFPAGPPLTATPQRLYSPRRMPTPISLPDFLPSIAGAFVEALAGAKIGFSVMLDDGVRHSIVYYSEVATEILGYTQEEVIGRDSLFCVAPEELPRIEERLARARRGEKVDRTLDTVIVRK